jgi:hypothetical protein
MNEAQARADELIRRMAGRGPTPTEKVSETLGRKPELRQTERQRREERLVDREPKQR